MQPRTTPSNLIRTPTQNHSTQRLSDVARYLITPEGAVATDWPGVRSACRSIGISFDEWQDDLGRLTLATRADGLYAADLSAISVARQVGKTHWAAGMTFGLCIRNPTTAIWTAHRVRTAAETYRAMQALARMPLVAPHVSNIVAALRVRVS